MKRIFRHVSKIAKSHSFSFVMSAPLARDNSAPTGRIFMKFDTWKNFSKICRGGGSKFHSYLTRTMATLRKDLCEFVLKSRWILHRRRNVSDKSRTENQNTRFMLTNFFSEKRDVYEIFSEWETFRTVVVEKIKKPLSVITFFLKIVSFII